MLVTSHIIPEILRMITYVLIARVIGGDTAQQYAIPGVIVLATTRMTISETSGLPVDDVWNKTLGSNVTGTLSPATQYLIRSLSAPSRLPPSPSSTAPSSSSSSGP